MRDTAQQAGPYVSTASLHNLLSKHLLHVQKGKGRKQKSPPPRLESDDLLLFEDCSNLPADNGERLLLGATGNTRVWAAACFPRGAVMACVSRPRAATALRIFVSCKGLHWRCRAVPPGYVACCCKAKGSPQRAGHAERLLTAAAVPLGGSWARRGTARMS